jgi:hypothetical protein
MPFRYDFAAIDTHDNLALLVEAKTTRGTDAAWAAEMRAIIGGRSTALASSTLLIVTPDRLYMWPPGAPLDAPPAETLDTEDVLRTHFERAGVRADRRMHPDVFEDLVGWWLHEVATGVASPPPATELEAVLGGIRGTRVVSERAA